jgi:hypothetical protein
VVVNQLNGVHLGLAKILVKAPFVDLVPLKISHFFGLLTKLSSDFPVVTLENFGEDLHLIFCLAKTVF